MVVGVGIYVVWKLLGFIVWKVRNINNKRQA